MGTTEYNSASKAGPWSWPDPQNKSVGEEAQKFYKFLDALYNEAKPEVRKSIVESAVSSEKDLRKSLAEWNINVPDNVRILVVDIQNARMIHHGNINPDKDHFYVLVIPPNLRIKDDNHRHWQALSGAWFHAINDGWGM